MWFHQDLYSALQYVWGIYGYVQFMPTQQLHIFVLLFTDFIAVCQNLVHISWLVVILRERKRETSLNTLALSSQVPLLPFLPVSSLFINIYLMLQLNKGTWMRFAIWMALGTVEHPCCTLSLYYIYVFEGRHSSVVTAAVQ